jgi:hypothetical protein
MKRTFGFDPLECIRCHAKMRPVALITNQHVAERILQHLSLPLRPEQLDEHLVGYDITQEPIPGWVLGMDPDPEQTDVRERGPPDDSEGVDPAAPD